mmetsp:Transcript_2582/g.5411  ORF Transcript_2582/g.5411 Transcript_2582/m.5411 type:complete len:108 (-) Transcript_2582:768-1091(-)
MPLAVLKLVNQLSPISRFVLSAPDELLDSLVDTVKHCGIQLQKEKCNLDTSLDETTIFYPSAPIALHTLLNWIENCGWSPIQMSEFFISSRGSSCTTYILKKAERTF